MDSGLPFNFGYLTNFIKGTPDFTKALENIRNEAINEDSTININQTAFININNFINKAEKERSGVKTTLTSKLNLWDDPLIQAATETSDFDMRDMRRQKITIYLGIPVNQLTRLSPLMNAFIQLFLNAMTKALPAKNEPYKVLAILDEFCALGHMQKLKEGFGYLAGFNIHLMAIIQNVGQFYGLYGGRDSSDTFFQNTDYKIIYRQNTKTDREFVSDLCGVRMVKNKTESFKQEMLSENPTGSSQSYTSKPLISADQVGKLPQQYGIAKFNGEQAVKYERIIYYKDPLFKDRTLPFIDLPEIKFAYVPFKATKPEQREQAEKAEKTTELPALNLPDLSSFQKITPKEKKNKKSKENQESKESDKNNDEQEKIETDFDID